MIQRIQSVFFLLTAICFGAEFTTSFASSATAGSGIFMDRLYNLNDHIILQLLAGLGLILSLVAIFLYKKRKNQIKLGYLITSVAIILPIISVLIYMNETRSMTDIEVSDQMGLYLPLGMILFAMLAIRFVKKDDRLVESMNRLR